MTRASRWDLSSETTMPNFLAFVGQMRLSGKRPVVEFVKEKRTLDQNDMAFALYTQIAEQVEDMSISEIRRQCKLVRGIPILRRDDAEFRELYNKSILHNLTYEEKLKVMEWFPVTRLFGKKQFSEYIDTIIRDYSSEGYMLAHPADERAAG